MWGGVRDSNPYSQAHNLVSFLYWTNATAELTVSSQKTITLLPYV